MVGLELSERKREREREEGERGKVHYCSKSMCTCVSLRLTFEELCH